MKKFLPKLVISSQFIVHSKKAKSTNHQLPTTNSLGFTLIELLVVIAIIAILSVIAISIYFSIQATVRDGRRRAEIDSLAKSIETFKDPVDGRYAYDAARSGNDYPQGFPQDPTPGRSYCIYPNPATTGPPTPLTTAWTGDCPGGGTTWQKITAGTTLVPPAFSWTICASLETSTPFCKTSLTK